MVRADAPAGQQDLLAGLKAGIQAVCHRAGEVAAGDVGVVLHQAGHPLDHHAVLVVERGVLHVDGDVAVRKLVVADRPDRGEHLAVAGIKDQRLEHGRPPHLLSRIPATCQTSAGNGRGIPASLYRAGARFPF